MLKLTLKDLWRPGSTPAPGGWWRGMGSRDEAEVQGTKLGSLEAKSGVKTSQQWWPLGRLCAGEQCHQICV